MNTYLILAGLLSLVGMFVSSRLKNKFQQYSQVGLRAGLSGQEVATNMLSYYGITDVKVTMGSGFLTDHYNPLTKTVMLSPNVYQGRGVASAAVAAHECGHAVQHAKAYAWLQLRSAMVPVVNFAARAQQWLLLLSFVILAQTGSNTLLLITIGAFAITTFFSLVTLPVEFDASRRGLVWLEESNVAGSSEYEGAKDALWWAAMTYVSAALSSLVILIYLILNFMGSRR